MAEKVNREFSWLDVIDSTDNVSNGESFSNETLIKQGLDEERNSGRKIPVPFTGTTYTFSSNVGGMADENALTGQEEERSERLGEELEKDFGDIEPSEPFGPIDPDDPEPGEPISNMVKVPQLEEFDPYSEQEQEIPEPEITQYHNLTKEEFEGLATKKEIKILTKAIKKLRTNVDINNKKSRHRNVSMLLWSVLISLFLIFASFFTIYYVIPKWFPDHAIVPADPHNNSVIESDEYAPTTVSGVSSAHPKVK